MSKYERQPDALPTNKALVSGATGVITYAQFEGALSEIWPQVAPGFLAGPAVTQVLVALAAMALAYAVAWWVPDRAGIA
jgi:hypothetical protein